MKESFADWEWIGGFVFKSLENFPKGAYGFIYKITERGTGKFYIGKKALIHNVKKKYGKKALAAMEGKGRGRKPSFEVIQKESDWKTYWSSSEYIKEEIKKGNSGNFIREVIDIAYSKRQLTYLEVKHQFINDVLHDRNSLNDNIGGRYFKKDFNKEDFHHLN